MKFLLLIYGDAAAEAAMTDDERKAIVDEHIGFARHLAGRARTSSARRSPRRSPAGRSGSRATG